MGRESDQEDLELLDRWIAGDRTAGNRLVRKHYASVTVFFNNAVSEDDRQDLAQKTFQRLITAKDGFRGDCSVRTYLFMLARRVLIDHLRSRYRRKNKGDLDPLTHSVEDVDGVTPSRVVADLQRAHTLLKCLRALPVDDKQLLELFYWQGCKAEELGKVFRRPTDGPEGVPEGTIRRRIHDTKGKLRKCLEDCSTPKAGEQSQSDEEIEDELRTLGRLLASGPSAV